MEGSNISWVVTWQQNSYDFSFNRIHIREPCPYRGSYNFVFLVSTLCCHLHLMGISKHYSFESFERWSLKETWILLLAVGRQCLNFAACAIRWRSNRSLGTWVSWRCVLSNRDWLCQQGYFYQSSWFILYLVCVNRMYIALVKVNAIIWINVLL